MDFKENIKTRILFEFSFFLFGGVSGIRTHGPGLPTTTVPV